MSVVFGDIASGNDGFTFSEVNICYEALDAVMEEKTRVMDDRSARDEGLIARWSWVGLRRAIDNTKVWMLAMPMQRMFPPSSVPEWGLRSKRSRTDMPTCNNRTV